MVKVRQKHFLLEAVQENPIFEDGRTKVKEHGFAVLFAACVELQELLRAAEEDRDRLFHENSELRTQVDQLQSRCGELSDRVRRLEDGESSAGLHETTSGLSVGECNHAAQQHGVWKKPQTHISRPSQVPPLHALLRGNFLVDSSSEGSKKHGALGESGVLQEDDVNFDEIPMGNDLWKLMDQAVRLRIEQWVEQQGRAVKEYGPLSEIARLDGASVSRSSHSRAPSATDHSSIIFGHAHGDEEGLVSLCDGEGLLSLCDDDSSSSDPDQEAISPSTRPPACESWEPFRRLPECRPGKTTSNWPPRTPATAKVAEMNNSAGLDQGDAEETSSGGGSRSRGGVRVRPFPSEYPQAEVKSAADMGECDGDELDDERSASGPFQTSQSQYPKAESTCSTGANGARWHIDGEEDEWRPTNPVSMHKEKLLVQRRAAQLRLKRRLRSSVETGPPVFASQTLFGRIMCGMQDRAPGVLHDALTPDLRDAFTPF